MTVKKPLVIGIAGGTCSGKSSIAKILIKEFDNKMSVNMIRQLFPWKKEPRPTMTILWLLTLI